MFLFPVFFPLIISKTVNRDQSRTSCALAVSVAGKGEFLSHRTPLQGKEPGQ
jgi:hypothetical protein